MVRPASYGDTLFDHNRQRLLWPVTDVSGAVLRPRAARGRATTPTRSAGSRVSGSRRTAPRWCCGPGPDGSGLVGEPLSLIRPNLPINPVDSLHFDPAAQGQEAVLAGAARELGCAGPARRTRTTATARRPALAPLAELRGWLEEQAERGTAGADPTALVRGLSARHRKLRDTGLQVFPELSETSAGDDPADCCCARTTCSSRSSSPWADSVAAGVPDGQPWRWTMSSTLTRMTRPDPTRPSRCPTRSTSTTAKVDEQLETEPEEAENFTDGYAPAEDDAEVIAADDLED